MINIKLVSLATDLAVRVDVSGEWVVARSVGVIIHGFTPSLLTLPCCCVCSKEIVPILCVMIPFLGKSRLEMLGARFRVCWVN